MTTKKFDVGCYCEGSQWEIETDHKADLWEGEDKCKHAGAIFSEQHPTVDGSTFETRHCIVPRVVIAHNEGGCNMTAVCLDCILEAASA